MAESWSSIHAFSKTWDQQFDRGEKYFKVMQVKTLNVRCPVSQIMTVFDSKSFNTLKIEILERFTLLNS